jgi:hypothetical protein
VSETESLAPCLAADPLNLLAAGATTLGEVIPLTSPARSSPLLPAKWLGRLFRSAPSNLRAGSPV